MFTQLVYSRAMSMGPRLLDVNGAVAAMSTDTVTPRLLYWLRQTGWFDNCEMRVVMMPETVGAPCEGIVNMSKLPEVFNRIMWLRF